MLWFCEDFYPQQWIFQLFVRLLVVMFGFLWEWVLHPSNCWQIFIREKNYPSVQLVAKTSESKQQIRCNMSQDEPVEQNISQVLVTDVGRGGMSLGKLTICHYIKLRLGLEDYKKCPKLHLADIRTGIEWTEMGGKKKNHWLVSWSPACFADRLGSSSALREGCWHSVGWRSTWEDLSRMLCCDHPKCH